MDKETREIAQLVKCLSCKCKDPSFSPRTHIKNPSIELYACNTNIGEAKIGGFLRFLGFTGKSAYINQ